ncbi:glutamyl-tRNA(Gln) amidotransferase subunit C, chloroplastic/mitochondrial [Iris pallida]|uniref:Glutamyl-tRNA(Gln) amidotransferase subunit C, chloroplastic/mitochondrial n=1 Tax=Iris pallida TaxID=29817 RepID=A0AAX6DYP6_IRIPA|nr:glutamyl-tRNA(Gln) amidotransferase subunit C, chloroplastic/mitochondrial [Iris pallida]KAJ6847168.1 glutamyl-tRNA(Gln) amidotransferase subunit C, chloroplastic/mitochondrial [Iris pallida]
MSSAVVLRGGSSLFRMRVGSPANLRRTRSLCSALEAPDVGRLAETARISLSPEEARDFAPKIKQVVDWFGQLQAVNLESVPPSLRADTEVSVDPREDTPEAFENREAIIAEIPSYVDPYIKVPKILNKE